MANDDEITLDEKAVIAQRRKMERAEQRYVDQRSKFRMMVHNYLQRGGSPTKLARSFDPPVTRGRIHQYSNAWVKETEREEQASA